MLSTQALRHQMILPEQMELFDYWRSLCKGDQLPSRDDLSPVSMGSLLPMLTILEEGEHKGETDFRFRLAGTGFWNIYNREISGAWLSDLPLGSRRAYWKNVCARVAERGKPSAGAGPFGVSGKTHMAQFWLRLPLAPSEDGKKLILGFDKFIERSRVSNIKPQLGLISA